MPAGTAGQGAPETPGPGVRSARVLLVSLMGVRDGEAGSLRSGLSQMEASLKAVPATGLQGGAMNPSLGAT